MSKSAIVIACWGAIICSASLVWMRLPAASPVRSILPEVVQEQRTDPITVAVSRNGHPHGHVETRLTYKTKARMGSKIEFELPFQDIATHQLLKIARNQPELFLAEPPDLVAIAAALKESLMQSEITSLRLEYARIYRRDASK